MDSTEARIFFEILPVAARVASRRLGEALRPFHLTGTQYSVLRLLDERPGQSPREIAEALSVDLSAVVGTITRMERDGYVRREVAKSDRRKTLIWPTEQARTAQAAAADDVRRCLAELSGRMGEDDTKALERMLSEIAARE